MGATLRYQPELDGLRALAIVPVVLFHAGVPGFRGGFVGVDVFFVISGFLITRLLLAELNETGRIDFLAFYARRIRRLLPALIVVIIAVLALGSVVLSAAGERQDLARSALATVAFASNIYFWISQASYFARSAEWLPFLHMWTLSVEEQFYLVWPGLLTIAAFVTRRTFRDLNLTIFGMMFTLFIASFAAFFWGDGLWPKAAFYLTPARVWEFTLGGAIGLADLSLRRFQRFGEPLVVFGFFALCGSVAANGHGVPIRLVLASFGAAAMIAGVSASPRSVVGRLLSTSPFVIVGKLSYSWYLWHWPLLALVRLYDIGHASFLRDLAVVCVAFGLAALTYAFVEDPIRRRKPWPFSSTWQTITSGGGLSVATALVCLVIYIQADLALRRDPWLGAIYAAKGVRTGPLHECHFTLRFPGLPPASSCLVGDFSQQPRVLLWGDSHAEHFEDMVRVDGKLHGYAGVVRTMNSCEPLLSPGQARLPCSLFNDAVAHEIADLARNGLTGVILASRWFGLDVASGIAPANAERWKNTLRATLSVARTNRLRLLIIAPVPNWQISVPECLGQLGIDRCGANRAAVDQARAPLIAAFHQIVGEFDNVKIWDPIDSFCDDRVCSPVRDGLILVADKHHLTRLGSRSLQPAAEAYLRWLVQ